MVKDIMKVVDFFGSLPTPERIVAELRSWGSDPGYASMFRSRWQRALGIPEEILNVAAEIAPSQPDQAALVLEPYCPDLSQSRLDLLSNDVIHAVVHGPLPTRDSPDCNESLAEIVQAQPDDTYLPFYRFDFERIDACLQELPYFVRTLNFKGVTFTPFWHEVEADTPTLDPLYELCADLSVPIWIHTSINWNRRVPMYLEHPSHLDQVAVRHPDTVIVAGHAGWPWVTELIAVAWRHPNVYIDFSAFSPKVLGARGSGWEPLFYYLKRTLSHKVVYGSTWALLGRRLPQLLNEIEQLELPKEILDRWMYLNAARVLGIAV